MLNLSDIHNFKANETADKKIEKLVADQEKMRLEIEKSEQEIVQGENKIKRLTQSLSVENRKARTKRLIERGALLEAFIPNAESKTNDEIKAVLAMVFRSGI